MATALPPWRTDFPVNWEDDQHVTRRAFMTLLTLISGAVFFGTGLLGVRAWWRRQRPARATPTRIAAVAEVPVGGVKLFRYPTPDDPCLLVRLTTDRFVAYSQRCPHLSCPVVYRAADHSLHCPCHAGRFAVEDGRVLAGPPRRPLARIALARRGEDLWALGVKR